MTIDKQEHNSSFSHKYEEKTWKTEPIYDGNIIQVQVDHVRLPDGRTATRELVKHSGAVGVLAVYNNKMLVVEQYRKPLERSLVEIPAGKLDACEDPDQAAIRELKEETGFTARSVKLLHSFYTSPGFADEIIHLYVATDLTPGDQALDEDEFLDHSQLTLEQALTYVRNGKIKDAKTIAAVYAWRLYHLTGKWEM